MASLTVYKKGGITVKARSPSEATRKINEVKRISKGKSTPKTYKPSSGGSSSSSSRYKVVGQDGKIYPVKDFSTGKAFAKKVGGAVIDTRSSQSSINKTLSNFSKSLIKTQTQKLKTIAPAQLSRAQFLNDKANKLYNQGRKNTQEFKNTINQINRLGYKPQVINQKKSLSIIQKSLDQQVTKLQTAQIKAQTKLSSDKNLIKPSEIVSFVKADTKSPIVRKLRRNGLLVPADIIAGVKDAFGKDWKNLITNFTIGFGAETGLRLIGSKTLTKAVGTVAVPLVLYDLGKSFRVMTKERGYTPAYALTRSFVSLGMAGAGAMTSKGVSSIKGVKIKVPRSKVRNVQALLRKTTLGKKILKALNTKKSNVFLFDNHGIVRVSGKSNTFKYQIEGNSYKNNFFTRPSKTHRYPLKDGQGVTRYVDSKTLKSFRKSVGKRTFEEGFKINKEIAIKKAKAVKVAENIKISKERLILRRQQKFITKGRLTKATRLKPTSKGYFFEDLRTGNTRYFKNYNQWIKAVKQQQKAIRLKEFKPKKSIKTSTSKKYVTRTGETIEIIQKKKKIVSSENWRIPRILRVVKGKPIFKYEKVSHAVYKKWAKAIRKQNSRKWKQGTLKQWDKMILESERHANLLNQLKTSKKPAKINVLANRFTKAVKNNIKNQEKLLKGEIKSSTAQRQQLLLKTKVVAKTKTKTKQISKIASSIKTQSKTRSKLKTSQVSKSKQRLILIAKQQQKLKLQQSLKQKQALKLVSKTAVIQTPKVIQSLQQALKVRLIQTPALKVTQANISITLTKVTQILNQNLRKLSLSTLTTSKIKTTIPRKLRKKNPNKREKEEIINWLKKQSKVYRPSLSAVLFSITGYAPPKTITGLEIRPIIIKRKKKR